MLFWQPADYDFLCYTLCNTIQANKDVLFCSNAVGSLRCGFAVQLVQYKSTTTSQQQSTDLQQVASQIESVQTPTINPEQIEPLEF